MNEGLDFQYYISAAYVCTGGLMLGILVWYLFLAKRLQQVAAALNINLEK